MNRRNDKYRAFTVVELVVVIGVIALLVGVLFPALLRVGRVARKTDSMSRMRQIHLWMVSYSADNSDHVLPSQFDYSDVGVTPYAGKVRTIPANAGGLTISQGPESQGTWADILWTENELGSSMQSILTAELELNSTYRYDSPDKALYDYLLNDVQSPLRSAGLNTKAVTVGDGLPTPFGDGASELNVAGFFAANDFFNSRSDFAGSPPQGNWYTNGQMRVPDRTMYLVDSFAGEIIAEPANGVDSPYLNPWYQSGEGAVAWSLDDPGEVDFRYNGTCLMLFLDGHIENQGPWADLGDLQGTRNINVTNPLVSSP